MVDTVNSLKPPARLVAVLTLSQDTNHSFVFRVDLFIRPRALSLSNHETSGLVYIFMCILNASFHPAQKSINSDLRGFSGAEQSCS